MQSKAEAPVDSIGFRLGPEAALALEAYAKQLNLSPHQTARLLVLQGLAHGPQLAPLERIESALRTLRSDLCLATEALLASAGKVSQSAASDWIQKNFAEQ